MCVLFQGPKTQVYLNQLLLPFVFTMRLSLCVAKHSLEILGSSETLAAASLQADITGIVSPCLAVFPVLKHVFLFFSLLSLFFLSLILTDFFFFDSASWEGILAASNCMVLLVEG